MCQKRKVGIFSVWANLRDRDGMYVCMFIIALAFTFYIVLWYIQDNDVITLVIIPVKHDAKHLHGNIIIIYQSVKTSATLKYKHDYYNA